MLVDPFGRSVKTPEAVPMSRAEILRFQEFERLLTSMGWQIVCANCSRVFGLGKDGVQSLNDPGKDTLEVRCGCSRHIFDPRATVAKAS